MIDTERIIGRLAAWMTALVIVAILLNGWALSLFHGDVEKARVEVVAANRRLDRGLELLRDADDDAQELLEGQRTLAEQLEAAGIAPAIDVPPRRPRRAGRPGVSQPPDRERTGSGNPTTSTTGPTSSTTSPMSSTSTTRPTTSTTRCLILDLGCEATLPDTQGGPGR